MASVWHKICVLYVEKSTSSSLDPKCASYIWRINKSLSNQPEVHIIFTPLQYIRRQWTRFLKTSQKWVWLVYRLTTGALYLWFCAAKTVESAHCFACTVQWILPYNTVQCTCTAASAGMQYLMLPWLKLRLWVLKTLLYSTVLTYCIVKCTVLSVVGGWPCFAGVKSV